MDLFSSVYDSVARAFEDDVQESFGKAGVVLAIFACTAVSCAIAAMIVKKKMQKDINWTRARAIVDEFRDSCATPLERLQKVADAMHAEMVAGLAKDGGSKLKMLLSYVRNLPSGEESGLYYALDLGGTNFRVLRVQLGGKAHRIMSVQHEEVSIPPDVMIGSNDDLFNYIAGVLYDFVAKEGSEFKPLPGQKRELGFTFSFPVSQKTLDSGTLVLWTKGFAIRETVGRDVVHELQSALHRKGMDMRVAALVNDTTGTLVGGRYHNDEVMMGLILGTGSNACYVERVENIPKWPADQPKPEFTVVNMEWGNFSCSHLPKTSIDIDLDNDSVNPGEQEFEKLFSGMYLGDVVRRVLLKLAQEACLFSGSIPFNLAKPFSLRTPQVSAMHEDKSADLKKVADVLRSTFRCKTSEVPLEIRKLVTEICDTAAARGARLVAAGIAGILKKLGREGKNMSRTVAAIDGGLYEHYPKFRAYMHEALVEILGKEAEKNLVVELSKDGSGIGAALVAASHSLRN